MFTRSHRALLFGSTAMAMLCLNGPGLTQTPPADQTPQPPAQTQPTPPAQQAPQPTQQTPPEPPAPAPPEVETLPPVVVVTPPPPRPAPPAPPAVVTAPPPPPPAPAPVAAVPFTPLSTITQQQIQFSTSNTVGGLFFTTPGATSAGLGNGPQRPILRGLDDFRVRVQENGLGSMDVSDLGQDHGVPIDPLAIQKVEIMRGPQALRFGSQATGGIVDVSNNRIPTIAPNNGRGGWETEFRGAATSVDRGLEGGILADYGTRNVAMHVDMYGRLTGNYFVPSYPYLAPDVPNPPFFGKQPNSNLHSEGQAMGGSYIFDGGYVGASLARFTSIYHVPTMEGAATNTRISMDQVKLSSKGEFRPASTAIEAIRYWAGATQYKHDEIGLGDDGLDAVRATFKNQQQEAKIEVQSMPLWTPAGPLAIALGTQWGHQQIDTAGDAGSLLGAARTNTLAAYIFNELSITDTLRLQFAGRVEWDRLDGTYGDFPNPPLPPPDDVPLTPAYRSYAPKSISFSVIKDLPSYLTVFANLQRNQRAPRALELFAHGAHDAPGTFEIGNPNLQIETANTAEIGLKRTKGEFRFDAKAYYTRYDNFIYRQATGNFCGDDFASCNPVAGEFIQTVYAQRDAIFRGGEIAWQWDLAPLSNGIFGIDGQYDYVRATFTDGSNVPRMPPMRLGGGAYWRSDEWFVRMGLIHAFAQTDPGLNETPTAGYNLLKLEISRKKYLRETPWGPTELTMGLVGDNLLDADVRNSVMFHKDEILLPGRTVKLFINAKFNSERPAGGGKAPYGYDTWRGSSWSPVYKAAQPGWTWAGFYLGGSLGYGFGRSNTDTSYSDALTGAALFTANNAAKLDGGVIGAQAGHNWQFGRWITGVEADLQISGQAASPTTVCPTAICNPALDAPVFASFQRSQKLEWFTTLRGRVGAALTPTTLLYATAGLAVGEVVTAGTIFGVSGAGDPVNTIISQHNTRLGWTAGVGLEARLTGNWTGKIEYLHLDLGSIAVTPTTALDATIAAAFNSRITGDIVRLGANYKFDPMAVVAKF